MLKRILSTTLLATCCLFVALIFLSNRTVQGANGVIYDDALGAGWNNYSWNTTVDFDNSDPVRIGERSLSARYETGWVGLYFDTNTPLSSSTFSTLGFWIHGGFGGQTIRVTLIDESENWQTPYTITPTANGWTYYEIPVSQLGNPAHIGGLVFQEGAGYAQATFYLDDVKLFDESPPPPTSTPLPGEPTHFLSVDVTDERHTISPLIYGMSFADEEKSAELNLPLNRWGGNAVTRYNWQNDSSNRANDYFYANVPNNNSDTLPVGSGADLFIAQNQRTDSTTLLTVPMIGWTPKDRAESCGFSISKYGAQDGAGSGTYADCGNGYQNGQPITINDPTDTSVAIDETFVQDWMTHLNTQHGANAVTHYSLDNEPMLWHQTHRDVHPEPVGYDEIRDLSVRYGATIKATDPSAQTLGPGVWGWTAYDYSAVDAVSEQWTNPPDRNAHGGTPFLQWYLQEMAAHEQSTGTRILDYLDLHFYPQQPGVTLLPAGDRATQELRLRSTRALWDSEYTDESWINTPIQLVPRMQGWIDANYPDTKIAITEYNFGGIEHINGAVTQAEVLGIFGREGVDLAVLWDAPTLNQPTINAFRAYLNYDGNGSQFGDVSLGATTSHRDDLSVFAARRSSDDALTLVVVNKSFENIKAELAMAGVNGSADTYQYSAANLSNIQRLGLTPITDGAIVATLPAQSFTILVIGGTVAPTTTPPAPTATPLPPTATSTPLPPTATPEPTPTTILPPLPTLPSIFVAVGEQTTSGTVNGDYTDTHVDDDLPELLIEQRTNGAPANRISYLEHTWEIELESVDGAELLFSADTWHVSQGDGDSFQFSYSTDGVNFNDMFVVADNGSATRIAFPFPSGMSDGTLYVRVIDLDRTPGNSANDQLYVDELIIEAFRTPTAVRVQQINTSHYTAPFLLVVTFGLLTLSLAVVSRQRRRQS